VVSYDNLNVGSVIYVDRTFTNTGDDLVSSSELVHMSLYSKTFPAGTVNLGANEGYQSNCSMYSVVVIKQ
jgi:hypothetical protein